MNRTKNAYDRWSANYDSDRNPQTALEQASVVEIVSPASGDRVLDAACGTGRYCQLFQNRGAEVVGVDFSEGMLNVAQAQLPDVEFHCIDMTTPLPFLDGAFSKVNCAQALKHILDIRVPLKEFSRVVTSDGTITFSVTHPEMNWEGYELSSPSSLNLISESDIYHYRFCDYFEAIDAAGLRLKEFRQVPVDESIREYLTPQSFQEVKGRYQIAIFHLVKDIV